MKVLEIAFTGYCVLDTKRARAFYEGILGLTPARTFGDGVQFEWIEYDIGAHTLAVIKGDGVQWAPATNGTSAALEVDDFDGFVAKVKANHVPIVFDVQDTPMCRFMVLADPDGNRIALHQRKPRPVP